MGKIFKRILATVMVVLMVITSVPLTRFAELDFINFSVEVSAEGGVQNTIDYSDLMVNQYLAKIFTNHNYFGILNNYGSDSNYPPHSLIENFYLDTNKASKARIIFNEFNSATDYKTTHGLYELLTFDASSAVEKTMELEDYYTAIFLSILDTQMSGDNLIDDLNCKTNKTIVKLSSTVSKYLETTSKYESVDILNTLEIESLEDEDFQAILELFAVDKDLEELWNLTGKNISVLKDIFSVGETINDSVKNIADFAQLANLSSDVKAVLYQIYLNCPNENLPMKNAARKVYEYVSEKTSYQIMALAQAGYTAFKYAFTNIIGDLWKSFLTAVFSELAAGVLIGQAVGKMITNYCFATDAVHEQLCAISALVDFEDAMVAAVRDLEQQYKDNDSVNNSNNYVKSLHLLMSVYDLGCDYVEDFVETVYEKGTINNIIFSNSEELQTWKKLIDEQQVLNQKRRSFLYLDKYKECYKIDAPSAYEAIYGTSVGDDKDEIVQITSMNVVQDKEISVGDKGSSYDFFTITYSPDNHTELILGETVSSSDESVIKVDDSGLYIGGYIYAVGTGTCTLTFTTYDLKYSTTIEVTVGEDDPTDSRAIISSGECGADGDNVTWVLYENGELEISGSGKARDYDRSSNCTPFCVMPIKSVIINKGITSIGSCMFDCCTTLESVIISDSVTTIGDMSFFLCGSFKSITIPDSVTSIGYSAFEGCTNLTSITIPDSVTAIGDSAFDNTAYYINENNWEDGILYINDHLICAKNVQDVTIRQGTKTISGKAFYNQDSLISVVIPDSVINIGFDAFVYCNSLQRITVDKNNKSYCNDVYGVLFNKKKTELINYPSGNTCTEYTIPDSIATIGDKAFFGCDSLTGVIIPDSVTTIGYNAFAWCDDLKDVYYCGTEEQWNAISIGHFSFSGSYDVTIHYNYCVHKNIVDKPQHNPTCTKVGYTSGVYCNDCKEWISGHEEIAFNSLNHVNKTDKPQHNPTCTKYGYTAGVYCSDCEEWLEGHEPIEPTNHKNKTEHPQQNATCTKDGYTAGVYCPDCEEWLEGHEIINKINHKNKTEYSQQNATCTKDGYTAGIYCPDCEEWLEGHDLIQAKHIDNDNDKTCDNCNEKIKIIVDSDKCGENVMYTLYDDGELVISGKGEMYNYRGYKDSPFYESDIKSVVIKEGVTSIGTEAFVWCEKLTDITISNSVRIIGDGAFNWCSSLMKITIPEGVTEIGDYVFSNCKFSSIVIPDSVIRIGEYAFKNCFYLNNITIGNNVVLIGDSAFYSCDMLQKVYASDVESWLKIEFGTSDSNPTSKASEVYFDGKLATDMVIPENITSINKYAFYGCSSFTSLKIPDTVTHIGEYAFYGCSIINVEMSNNLNTISKKAFSSCYDLKNIVFGSNVTNIAEGAFSDCYRLVNVTIPNSVTNIGDSAFDNCYRLENITINNDVTKIGTDTFSRCDRIVLYCNKNSFAASYAENNNIRCVYLDGTEKESVFTGELGKCTWKIDKRTGVLEISGNGNMYDLSSAYPWHKYKYYITDVILHEGLTRLGARSFEGFYRIRNITIPDSVTTIGFSAFQNCENLNSLAIPNNITTIESYAFYSCRNIESVTMGNNVRSIGSYAFYYCDSLEKVYASDVESWLKIEFKGSYANPMSVAEKLYFDGELLSDIVIPKSITAISNYAFDNCVNLKSVTIPYSVTTIGEYAFHNCKNLKSITIPYGVTSIGDYAFCRAYELENITIVNSATTIGDYAFDYCDRLKDIYFNGTEKQWYNNQNHSISYLNDVIVHFITITCSHKNTKSYTSKASTCSESGWESYVACLECSYTTYKELPLKAHTITTIKGKAATCTATGLTDGKKCSVCGEVTVKQTTIAKKAHTLVTVKGKAATCTATGLTEGKKCSVCGEVTVKQTIIAKKAHTLVTVKGKAATCTATGLTDGKKCSVCGTVTVTQKTIAKKAHTYTTATTKATLTKNGKVESKCSVCGYVSKTTIVYYPKTIKLSTTSYTYNGKTKTPTVTVKDSKGNTLKKDTDYTVKYESGRKNTGKYSVTIAFKGNYSGTKTLSFTIAPQLTSKVTATQTTTSVTLKWNKVTGATGYRVFQKVNGKWKILTNTSKLTYTVKKLKAGTNYTFAVRPYAVDGKDTILASSFTQINTATKCKTPTLKLSSTKKGIASASWTNVAGETGYELYGSSKKNSGFKSIATTKADAVKASKKKLTSKKTYYFKVRAYKTVNGVKVYSDWSTVKSVKVK